MPYYFAYGSNMNPARLRGRCVSFRSHMHAVLKGYGLRFNKVAKDDPRAGYANVVPEPNGAVEGVLYELSDGGIERLDHCEGCPCHYRRMSIEVELDDGRAVNALIYVAQPGMIRDGLKPKKEYLAHLLAAQDLLSQAYRAKLAETDTLD